MFEIEVGIRRRQCLDGRIANLELLESEVATWQRARNEEKRTIEWNFTRQDADQKRGRHCVLILRVDVLDDFQNQCHHAGMAFYI